MNKEFASLGLNKKRLSWIKRAFMLIFEAMQGMQYAMLSKSTLGVPSDIDDKMTKSKSL